MADQDDPSRTEEPTGRRLQQGRERGQVAVSQDVKTWGMLAGGALALAMLVPMAGRDLMTSMTVLLENADRLRVDPAAAAIAPLGLLIDVGRAVGPILALLVVTAVAVTLTQVGVLWAPAKIAPEFGRLSPLKGLERIFSLNGLVEFGKGLVKIGIVAAVFTVIALPVLREVDALSSLAPGTIVDRLHRLVLTLFGGTLAVMAVVAAIDYVYQRIKFLKQMRMTRQEVRDEHKQSEGDPQIKARIRRLRVERARRRMMAAVPQADVVITNPTHYAVALRYDMARMAAPTLVAKGADLIAHRIRELAKTHDVPIVENPPLARSLYASVDLDAEIPPELYEAVARVIGYVMQIKRRAG
jgi:flagellar biosynthetic protein FlhB